MNIENEELQEDEVFSDLVNYSEDLNSKINQIYKPTHEIINKLLINFDKFCSILLSYKVFFFNFCE